MRFSTLMNHGHFGGRRTTQQLQNATYYIVGLLAENIEHALDTLFFVVVFNVHDINYREFRHSNTMVQGNGKLYCTVYVQ